VILFRVFPGRSLNRQRQTAIERLGLQPFPGKEIPVLKAMSYAYWFLNDRLLFFFPCLLAEGGWRARQISQTFGRS